MITFEKVSKIFGSGNIALDEVSFKIEPGEFVFITGHSGSGKTTLLRLLLREYFPTNGRVFFNEQDLSQLSRGKVARHRQKVGVVFQDYKLLDDLTVWENIALPLMIAHQQKEEVSSRINELLKMLDLQGREDDFPSQLSGGEAQRVGLARALSIAPKVIFADEPTGNLDENNGQVIVKLLKAINKYGTTIIFATHNLKLLAANPNARHLTLDRGQLTYDSNPKDFEQEEEFEFHNAFKAEEKTSSTQTEEKETEKEEPRATPKKEEQISSEKAIEKKQEIKKTKKSVKNKSEKNSPAKKEKANKNKSQSSSHEETQKEQLVKAEEEEVSVSEN